MSKLALSIFIVMAVFSRNSWAFPEMVRHGYVNCTSCHVSPTGGGVLTSYGRSLSREVLSTVGTENETRWLYFVTPPENVNLGGDVRTLQLYANGAQFSQAKLIQMQTDTEGAVKFGKFTFDATLGYVNQNNPQTFTDYVALRRHFIMYEATDEVALRFGKFLYSYGINQPDHTIATKRGINVNDEGTETYNLELSWLNDRYNVYATADFGRPDDLSLDRERGATLNTSVAIAEKHKIGFSYLYGYTSAENRHVFGPWGIFGFTPHFFLLSELDFTAGLPYATATDGRTWGFADSLKLDYEYFQGFHGFLSQGMVRPDFNAVSSLTKSYGIGIQFFPRPHWDLDLEWQIHMNEVVTGYTDYAFVMLHFYL